MEGSMARSFQGLILGMLLLVAASPARADLYAASVTYQKGDFASAFAQYKELAELGQPEAQYNLAAMYQRGEGVQLSNVYAHAWFCLASANGFDKASAGRDLMEPRLTPTSLQISRELQDKFSRKALDTRLMPRFLQGREFESRDPPRGLKHYMPAYPPDAQRHGVQGEVFVEFIVAPDGRPRSPRIIYALPVAVFDDAVINSVMHSSFLPGRINGQPVATPQSMFYRFVMGYDASDYGGLERRVATTLQKANEGDPSAQMIYGMMIAGLPQLRKTYDQALPWFLKAAQAGVPYAQYQIGTGLLAGRGCQCDDVKGEIWLEKAAQADQPDAQVSLADYLLRDKTNESNVKGALVWLERAASHGNDAAKMRLAAILAADPSPDIRNPGRALSLVDSLERGHKYDPSLWEIKAAAAAAHSEFKTAVKAQAEAVSRAKALEWDVTAMTARQQDYASNQTWTGNLLAF
jgi:TonB family protein